MVIAPNQEIRLHNVCPQLHSVRILTYSLTHSLPHSLPHSLTHSFPPSHTSSLPPSLPHTLRPSLPPSLTHSLPPSLTHSPQSTKVLNLMYVEASRKTEILSKACFPVPSANGIRAPSSSISTFWFLRRFRAVVFCRSINCSAL